MSPPKMHKHTRKGFQGFSKTSLLETQTTEELSFSYDKAFFYSEETFQLLDKLFN